MNTPLKLIPVSLLIILWVYAAAVKLLTFRLFVEQLSLQPLPPALAAILAYLIPYAELASAFMLCHKQLYIAGLYLSLAMLSIFSLYIVLVLTGFWQNTPCPCGGLLNHMPWGAHLAFNCFFLLMTLIAINIHFKERRKVTASD